MSIRILAAAAVLAAAPAFANDAHHAPAPAAVVAASDTVQGEVRRIDRTAKKITLKHGALANLGMPPMTMVFAVKDPAALDKVKQGDTVRFTVESLDGTYTVTMLEPALR